MIDDKMKDHTVMNAVSYFSKNLMSNLCEFAISNKRLEDSDVVSAIIFAPQKSYSAIKRPIDRYWPLYYALKRNCYDA